MDNFEKKTMTDHILLSVSQLKAENNTTLNPKTPLALTLSSQMYVETLLPIHTAYVNFIATSSPVVTHLLQQKLEIKSQVIDYEPCTNLGLDFGKLLHQALRVHCDWSYRFLIQAQQSRCQEAKAWLGQCTLFQACLSPMFQMCE
jgi:hypothetical protein